MSYHMSLGEAYVPAAVSRVGNVATSIRAPATTAGPVAGGAAGGRPPVTAIATVPVGVATMTPAPSGKSPMLKIAILAGLGIGGFFLYRRFFKKGS